MLPFFWYLYLDFVTHLLKYTESCKKKMITTGNNALVSLGFVNEPVNERLELAEWMKEKKNKQTDTSMVPIVTRNNAITIEHVSMFFHSSVNGLFIHRTNSNIPNFKAKI